MRPSATLMTLALLLAAGVSLTVAQQPNSTAANSASPSFALTSSAFAAGAEIPGNTRCKGGNASPALQWSGRRRRPPASPSSWTIPTPRRSVGALGDVEPAGGPRIRCRKACQDRADGRWLAPGPQQLSQDRLQRAVSSGEDRRTVTSSVCMRWTQSSISAAGRAARDLDAAMKGHMLAEAEYMGTFHA